MNFVKIVAAIALIAIAAFAINRLIIDNKIGSNPKDMAKPAPPKIEKLSLKTVDGVNLSAAYYSVSEKANGAVVFVHMMPATKESWDELAKIFLVKSYSSIAIDLRGHGESDGGPKSYAKFSDEEHQKSILDLDAAAKFLMSKGFTQSQIVFIGASIGANLSLRYIADHPEYKTAVLLSAGADYRGIQTEPAARILAKEQRILIVSARDDDGNAAESESIFKSASDEAYKEIKIYERGGHGTNLLENQADLQSIIVDFVIRGSFGS